MARGSGKKGNLMPIQHKAYEYNSARFVEGGSILVLYMCRFLTLRYSISSFLESEELKIYCQFLNDQS